MQLLHAQSKYLVVQKDAQVGKIKAFQKFKNENELQQYLSNLQQQYIAKGYLEFSIDSTQRKSDSLIAFLHVGEQYEIKNKQPSVKKERIMRL